MELGNIKNVSVIGACGMGSQLTQILSLVGRWQGKEKHLRIFTMRFYRKSKIFIRR